MPLKDIDLPFEIQYIISFIALIIGFIALDIVEYKLLYVQTLFGAIVHMILLSLVYLYPRGLKYQSKIVDTLKEITMYSLLFVIFSFTYLVIQIALLKINSAILISIVLPSLVVILMGLAIASSIGSLTKWNQIDFLVNPLQIRVYRDYEASDPVILKVTNNLTTEISLCLTVDLPYLIDCNINNKEYKECIQENFKLGSKKSKVYELYFKHTFKDTDIAKVKIALEHDYGKFNEELTLFIRK